MNVKDIGRKLKCKKCDSSLIVSDSGLEVDSTLAFAKLIGDDFMNNICPRCTALYAVNVKDIGRKLKCKKCGSSLIVSDSGLEVDSTPVVAKPTPMRQRLSLPFDAYTGREPFLFVSYSHLDAELVYPEIDWLNREGYRIWYDEGISPGKEWPEEIARALLEADLFLVFVSSGALTSRNVRNEINMAVAKAKPFLAVHLEETELPASMELQIGSLQAIFKYQLEKERYQRRLVKALPVNLRTD